MATFAINDYMEGTMLTLGWVVNNGIWDALTSTGIAVVPFIALVAGEWFRARQEGDDEGNKGVLSLNRIESRLYVMLLVLAFTCVPVFTLNVDPVNVNQEHADQCGTVMMSSGQWGESTMTSIDGQQARVPMWWALTHSISKGITNVAVSKIPCSTDYQSVRTALDLTSISDPGLKREVGEFQLACFGPARNKLFQSGTSLDQAASEDVDWIGSDYFLDTAGYYDSFYAPRPMPGFPYQASRDEARPSTGPGQSGYPSCREWWSDNSEGIAARLADQVDTTLWSRMQSFFPTGSSAEEYMIRRMVSPRSGAANGNTDQASIGYRDLDGGVDDAVVAVAGMAGNALATVPFRAGMDSLKQSLPMIQGIMLMAIIICLPFVSVASGYSVKVAGLAMFGLFGLFFLTFWWELARWLDSHLVDLLYDSDAAKMSWLAGVENTNDKLVMGLVNGMMFIVLPSVWIGVMGWAGAGAGNAISSGIAKAGEQPKSAGGQAAEKAQNAATK
ncbi:conjugal transfer protein TraG N-terminal domain-containing protein [Salinicola sp. JS01]|uniref:conjugal transfer protein TraG N-terminal domain-containing protein n=1 Tax=Salinicola sp. JS01 TaxID=3050071 RepID=UPI00255B70E0|nr:conjugal transfer protein TraG N-terminal domain-containing protein [Salinicola sp. JS01]WIX33259.1 conjugal transfer protein TraG N-terminal domain-containing protein [Salinicola sp. JS01]